MNKFIVDKNAFLFNIDKKEKFMIKDEKKSFVYYDTKNRKEIIFEFGDLDLVINEEWDKGKKNLSKFPKNYITLNINYQPKQRKSTIDLCFICVIFSLFN